MTTPKTVPGTPAAPGGTTTTPAQVGLAWLLNRYERALLIPGMASPAHLADNIAAGSIRLDPDAVAALDAIAPI